MDYVIAVDIGTQGTKAGLLDQELHMLDTEFEESNIISSGQGRAYEEPEKIYGSVIRVIRRLSEKCRDAAKNVRVISIDSQMAGIMGVKADGSAASYYDSWLDTGCWEQVERLKKYNVQITEKTGGPVSFTHGPKMLWWKETRPEIYRDICKFVLPHAYVVGRLCGLSGEELYMDYTSLPYSGCADNKNKVWSEEITELIGIDRSKLAKIVSPFEIVGSLTAEAAEECGLSAGIPLTAGSGDTSASLYGLGIDECGALVDCAGTASVLSSVVKEFRPDTENGTLSLLRSPADGLWYPLAYINGGGMNIRWFRDFAGSSYDELEQGAQGVAAGSEGLLCIPHFSGRVLPNDNFLAGSFTGVHWKHTKYHFYRAIMESIAYEYAYYLGILKKLYPDTGFHTMHSIGGGSNSDLFSQIKADVLGSEVITYQTGDTALLGDGAIGLMAVGSIFSPGKLLEGARVVKKRFAPDEEKHRIYEEQAEKYLKDMEIISQIYHRGGKE